MADPLHFGTLGGLPTKIVWFLFGVTLAALSVTGIMIHSNRLAEADGVWAVARRGIGRWLYPSLALILVALCLSPVVLAG